MRASTQPRESIRVNHRMSRTDGGYQRSIFPYVKLVHTLFLAFQSTMLLASANTAASNQFIEFITILASENLSWPPSLASWLFCSTASRAEDSASETSSEKYGVPAILFATTSGASFLALKSDEGRIAVVP